MILKKIMKLFVCLIILYLVFLLGSFCYWRKDKHPTMLTSGYYKEEFYRPTDDMVSYRKYYYKESIVIDKKHELGKENIDIVKDYISTTLSKLHELDNSINIEFNYDDITPNDYYLLVNDSDFICFEYYDVEKKLLYEMYFSK